MLTSQGRSQAFTFRLFSEKMKKVCNVIKLELIYIHVIDCFFFLFDSQTPCHHLMEHRGK